MKPKRIRHNVRINPETHDPEFVFYFRHAPDTPVGWFTLDEVIAAARHAHDAVATAEFNRIMAAEFPHQYTDNTSPE